MKARVLQFVGLALLVASCATSEQAKVSGKSQQIPSRAPEPSHDSQANSLPLEQQLVALSSSDRQNLVLELMELGKTALLKGQRQVASNAFDQALNEIETIYRADAHATQARSLWYDEGRKTFKGEPYERVMAYFYRGLLYLYQGDYGNARASFEGGILQDAFAEEEQYRADFALMHALSYWSALKFDQLELAALSMQEFKQLRPTIQLPPREHNVLIIAETGYAPRKLSDGPGHTALVYRRGKGFKDENISLLLSSRKSEFDLNFVEDLFFQASTRGGRQVDKILDGKLKFQQASVGTGKNLADSANYAAEATRGSTTDQSSIGRYVGATKALSALALGIGAKIKPQADIRYWTSLPDRLHIGSMTMPVGTDSITASFYSADGKKLPALTRNLNVTFDSNGNGILWIGRTQKKKE